MKFIKIDKAQWADGFEKLSRAYGLIGPKKDGEFHNFKALAPGELPDFDCLNTRLSAKHLVYPQSEVMFEYSLDESREDHHLLKEPPKDYADRAVVGIRPCDADAFLLVKRNFDTPVYKDPYWLRAYEATTLVGLACGQPCSTCFCTSAGSGPFSRNGLDLLLVEQADHYLAAVITTKGEKFMAAAEWQDAVDPTEAEARIDAARAQAETHILSEVATDRLAGKTTTEIYDAPFWEDVSFACINCGTCTYLCPTCWCFDIQDETHGNAGVRMRNWDSCMYPLFTLHGSGHNPRVQKLQRVRQRFMHKLKYYVDKYGNGIQCVGCGRCVQFCPVNIDIRKVCNQMNAYGSETVCEVPTNG